MLARLGDARRRRAGAAFEERKLAPLTHDQHDDHEQRARRSRRRSPRTGGRTASRAAGAQRINLLDRHADDVALAVNGLDDRRRARVVAQRLPQAADAHIDAAIERIEIAAAQQLHQLRRATARASDGPAAPTANETRRRSARPACRPHASACASSYRAANRRSDSRARSVSSGSRGMCDGAPQDRLDASDQLARAERFRQIVVGADFEPDDAIDLLAQRGQHQHRHLRMSRAVRGTASARLRPAASDRARSDRRASARARGASPCHRRRP